jgi:hypothetical protein
MPTRRYSPAILGGLWPTTSADTWSDVADALRQKAHADADASAGIRRAADGLYPDNSGHMIDGMHAMYMRDGIAVMDQSDLYQTVSSVVDEIAQLIYHARTQLDEIDRTANEKIEQLKAAAAGGGIGAAARLSALVSEIAAIIAAARGAAEALSASVAGEIASQAVRIGAGGNEKTPSGSKGPQINPADFKTFRGAGGGPLNGGMPNVRVPPPLAPDGDRPVDRGQPPAGPPQDRPTDRANPPDGQPRHQPSQESGSTNDPLNERPLTRAMPPPPSEQIVSRVPLGTQAPTSTSGPSFPMTGGPTSGLNFPSTGMPTGTTSAPPTSSGLGNPASGLTTPATSAVPHAAPNDFSRGLNAGLGGSGGGAPLLPPPVSSPPPSQLASTAGSVSGPPPVMPAAGPPASAAPVSASAPPPAPPISGTVMPPAPAAPLPPFTSDLPRQAAPVTPASGPASASIPPAAPPPGAASPPVAPLPPGVVGSGVGAAAVGAGVGVRSSAPDPLLEGASRLVYELMHASRLYAAIDWCVGVFKTPSGPQTVVVSSEGAGYIPPGVFLPRSVRLLFSDPGLSDAFRARWFAWVNPAQTMLAYAATCTELDPNIELYAVAVSTDHGGSALPARDAGVRHYEDCSLLVSPIKADASAPNLDANRMHRLEALDRAEYARLTRTPDRSESWTTTETAVRVALSRASALLGFSVPPAIRQISQVLGKGEAVTDEQWSDLEMVRVNAILDSASQRPGRMLDSVGASPYARAYHNLARLAELLALWRGNDPQHAEIAYTAAQIPTEARLWPAGTE